MELKCFLCGVTMYETRFTPVGELPPREKYPPSLYFTHTPKQVIKTCPVSDYVIQVGYRA